MKPIQYILAALGVAVLGQELTVDQCEISYCPQVKCPADTTEALCKCLVGRETRCLEKCPNYKPNYQGCPAPKPIIDPTVKPVLPPISTGAPRLPPKPVICECPQVLCLQVWPGSCHCANAAAQNCYEKCGGAPPLLQDCSAGNIRRSESDVSKNENVTCECEEIMCIQAFPESCYCANAAAERCYQKCGGIKPKPEICPPHTTKTLTTKTLKPISTSRSQPTPTVLPPNPHQVCGGGRANYLLCDEGYTCITDPYTPGCGPACDGLGICVKDKLCGGFAAFACGEAGQVCHDDPRDDCDPTKGGADCGGLCIWPHRSLYEETDII